MMKKRVFCVMATCCFLAVVAATAHAQMPGTAMRATIPFDFIVRGRTLPAGDYEVRRINDEPAGLRIQNVHNYDDVALFETEAVEARKIPNRGEIVFQRYGDRYFLSEVFAGGEQTGRELLPSRQERNLKRELASNKTEAETVMLAAY
jgi:hypothetical protein